MNTEDSKPLSLREARDGVRSLQFFVAAMAAQLRDLHDKLDQATLNPAPAPDGEKSTRASTGAPSSADAGQASDELVSAWQETTVLRSRVEELERENADLQRDLARQNVTFADHHAAKQEIARLRAELDAVRGAGDEEAGDRSSLRKRWSLGK